MDQLPFEINIEIFLYISQKQRNKCLKTVCKKWYDILKDPIFYFTIQLYKLKQWDTFSTFATNSILEDNIPLGHYVRQLIFKKENINQYHSYDFLQSLQLACPFITHIINFPFMNDLTSSSSIFTLDEESVTTNDNEWYYLTHLPLEYTHIINWQEQKQQHRVSHKKKKSVASLQLYYYNPLFNHDDDIHSFQNKRLRIKLLERQRRQKSALIDDFWRLNHTNHTEFLWHITNLTPLSSSFINLSYLDINFDLYFLPSIDQQNTMNQQHIQQEQQQSPNIIDPSIFILLFNTCPSLITLKLRHLIFNITNQYNDKTLFHLLKSLEHLYLDHCTFLNPQCYTFFTSFPSNSFKSKLKTLDIHQMKWSPFINIHQHFIVLQYKNNIYSMLTSFPLLTHLNINYIPKKNEENDHQWNDILLPNIELLEWLTNQPKKLSYFGYQYELLLSSFNEYLHHHSYLNHLTTLHIEGVSTSFLLYQITPPPPSSSLSIILSTSIKTLILSGEKKNRFTRQMCYVYHWLNVFPRLKSLKISKMKINTNTSIHRAVSTYYSTHETNLQPKYQYDHLREFILEQSEFIKQRQEHHRIKSNDDGLDGLLKRCIYLNKLELSSIQFGLSSSLWGTSNHDNSSLISFHINASHLKLDYLKISNITFCFPTTSSSSRMNYLDTFFKNYKVLYTIEEIGSTKDIIFYNSDEDNHRIKNKYYDYTIKLHLQCQTIDQLDFY